MNGECGEHMKGPNRRRTAPREVACVPPVVVRIGHLAVDERWPAFCVRAASSGWGSSVSVPMMVRTRVAGVVNLSAGAHGLGEADLAPVRELADEDAGAVAVAVRLAEREERLATWKSRWNPARHRAGDRDPDGPG